MFAVQQHRRGSAGLVDVAFTDRYGGVSKPPFDSLDLGGRDPERGVEFATNLALVAGAFSVTEVVTMRQVHGREVIVVESASARGQVSDALVTTQHDVALAVRVADCVPVVLADAEAGVVAVAHAGRAGVAEGVVGSAVDTMRSLGAGDIDAWIGPHVCGGCYEVPEEMRAAVAGVEPAAFACTTWGTPSLDLGAAVAAQLERDGCSVTEFGMCTRESADFYSHRRDGASAGRFAGIVVLRGIDRG